jgi:hypothetical protein
MGKIRFCCVLCRSNWTSSAGTYEVSFSGINGTAFVYVTFSDVRFSLSVIDKYSAPSRFSLLGQGFSPELCSNTQLFFSSNLMNRTFCNVVYTSIYECRCNDFDPDSVLFGSAVSIHSSGYEALRDGIQTLYWNVSKLLVVFKRDILIAAINRPPVVNITRFLVVRDFECQNFSRVIGTVSPGNPSESNQTLSIVVRSYTSSVSQFDIPVNVFIQDMTIYVNFSLPVHIGNVSIVFEVYDSGGSEYGGLNKTEASIVILFIPSIFSPKVLTSMTFDFNSRFAGDLSSNQEIVFLLKFGEQQSKDAFTVYRLLGCNDVSLFETQPRFLSIKSSSFESSAGSDLALTENVTYSSAITDMTVAVRLSFKLAVYKVGSSDCSLNITDSFQNTAQVVIRIQSTFLNHPPSFSGTTHTVKQRNPLFQIVDLHHPYTDQVITSVLCVVISPLSFNESELISFNESSVRFAFDNGRFRSFVGTLVVSLTLFANGSRSGQSVVTSNISIEVIYENMPPSIVRLSSPDVFFVEVHPGQDFISFPAIVANVGESEYVSQELLACFFQSVQHVSIFKSLPVFTVLRNQSNITLELKKFEHIPYGVDPVIFYNVYCLDNGGQGTNAKSNVIETLTVQLVFAQELPSFLSSSGNFVFTELAFSGVFENELIVNGNSNPNQSGFFALNQGSEVVLNSSALSVHLNQFEASPNSFGIESGSSGASKITSMPFTVNDWHIVSAVIEGNLLSDGSSVDEQNFFCSGSSSEPVIRGMQSGMFIAVSNISAPHVCFALMSLQMVHYDGKWDMFAYLSESRIAIGSSQLRNLAEYSNSNVFAKSVHDMWATATRTDPNVVRIRVRQIRAVARHGGIAYRVPLNVFSRDILYRIGSPSLSYSSSISSVSAVIGSQLPCESGSTNFSSGLQVFYCNLLVLLDRFDKSNLTFIVRDSAGNVSLGVSSSFKQVNSPPRMFCSVPWTNMSVPMAVVAGTIAIPGFCSGISRGNAYENDSQELSLFVQAILGQRIISHVSLSVSGTLSLGLVPFSLGRILLNFTVSDSGGNEYGAVNVWSHSAQILVQSSAAVNQPPFASLHSFSAALRGSSAFVNITACAGPGDESTFQNATVTFLTCSNGVLLGKPCNYSFEIVWYSIQGSARDLSTGLTCPLWAMEYRIPRDFIGAAAIAANVTDEYGSSFLLNIPVDVGYVNNPPDFLIQPKIIELLQPESLISTTVSFSNISAGYLDVDQSIFFNVVAKFPSEFTEQPSLSSITFSDSSTASAVVSFSVPIDSIGKNITLLFFITDSGGTVNGGKNTSRYENVILVLIPVNKPPRFSLNSHLVTVLERSSQYLQKIPNFAFNISAGQPAEHAQILQFHCDADNVFLFEIQPSISLDGTLTFKPASNSFGQSNVTVQLFEIGGLALRTSSYVVIQVERTYDAPAILSFLTPQLHLQEGSISEFDKFVLFTHEPNLPSFVLLRFNVSVILNKSAPFFLLNPDASLVNVSVSNEGKLYASCSLKSWGQVIVGVSLMQTVVSNGVQSSVSLSDVKMVSIFVSAVNDPPSFLFESETLIISQQQTSFSSTGFIRNIEVGPSDEKEYQVISQMVCLSPHQAIKSVVVVSQCLHTNSCPFASLNFDLIPYSQGSANVTCCVSETPPGTCDGKLTCSSTTCKQFEVLIPAVLHLISNGDITVNQTDDAYIPGVAVMKSSHIRVITPNVFGVINSSLNYSESCIRLFTTLPNSAISNVSYVDISFVPDSRTFGECRVTVIVSFVHAAGTDVSSVTFMIRLMRTNRSPYFFLPFPFVNVLESSGSYSIIDFVTNISAGNGDSDQGVSFVAEEIYNSSNVFSVHQVFSLIPSIDSSGCLKFNVSPYFHGFFAFALRLSDFPVTPDLQSRNSTILYFYINILPVNDKPVFTLKQSMVTVQSSAQPQLQAISIFASINPGPHEDNQSLRCVVKEVSKIGKDLFVVPPVVFGTGMFLSFQLAPYTSGFANYTVTCYDDGNSLNGGSNQSLPASISFEIIRPNSPPFFELDQTLFVVNSSSTPASHSFQPFTVYSPSRDYVKNSISRFSIDLLTGNSSVSTLIRQHSRSFDPLTQLLPLYVRRRAVDYVTLSYPNSNVLLKNTRFMFVSEKTSAIIGSSSPSIVSAWKLSGDAMSASKTSQIQDGMVHFSTFNETVVSSLEISPCFLSSAASSGRVFLFMSFGCVSVTAFGHSDVLNSTSLPIIADFVFDRTHVHQQSATSRSFDRLRGSILGIGDGIRYFGDIGAMLCSPTSGGLRLNNSAVLIQSLSQHFSISLWFAVGSLSSDSPLMSASKSANDNMHRGWILVVDRQGRLKFSVSIMQGSVGTFLSAISAPNLVVAQKWTHVLASFSDKSIDLYANGALVAQQLFSPSVVFRSVVYSQLTDVSNDNTDVEIFVGAAYDGSVLSKFHGVIASCTMYASFSIESDAISLYNSGSFIRNRFLDISEYMFAGNANSLATEHTFTFVSPSAIVHVLNKPIPDTSLSFEIHCALYFISGACSISSGGQLVTCPLIPTNRMHFDPCSDAPFYLLANSSRVLASTFVSRVTIRYSSVMMISQDSSSNFEIVQDFPEASGSMGSASVNLLGKQYLFFPVTNTSAFIPISPAYALEGSRFQRQSAMDVRVAAVSAVSALALENSRSSLNQFILPCLYVAYASLTDTSFVFKFDVSGSNTSLVKTFVVPFAGGASSASISDASTKYGSDVILVSFCGFSGCQIFMLNSGFPPFVVSVVTLNAKAIWLFPLTSSSRILVLVSFSSNTSSYEWDGSVYDQTQIIPAGLSKSLSYVTNLGAISASMSLIGSQDVLFIGLPRNTSIFRFDVVMKAWSLLTSFSSPSNISTSVVISDLVSSGAFYVSVFASSNNVSSVITAQISISQGAELVSQLQSCDNTQSLFILRSLHTSGMNDAVRAVSWFNVSSGTPSLVSELSHSESMSLLESRTFAVDCSSGYVSVAHSGGIALLVANVTTRSLQIVSSITPASSIFGADLLAVTAMAFATFPERPPVLILSSRVRGCVDTFILSNSLGGVRVEDGSTFRDGQKHLNWLTRSVSPASVFNKSLPFWSKDMKSFYSFVANGHSYVVLHGKCNDPFSSTPAILMKQVSGNWIFQQELPGTRGACVASSCQHANGRLFLLIGVNAFGGPSQQSVIFEFDPTYVFFQILNFQYVGTMAVVDVTSYMDAEKCSYVLVQKTDGVLPSGSLSPLFLHFDSELGRFVQENSVNITAYNSITTHKLGSSRVFVMTRRNCWTGTGSCRSSLSVSTRLSESGFQELASVSWPAVSSMQSLLLGDTITIAMVSHDFDSSIFQFRFQFNTLAQTGIFPPSFGCLVYRLGTRIQLAFLNEEGLGFRDITNALPSMVSVIPPDYMYDDIPDELKSKMVLPVQKWSYNPDSLWKLQLQQSSLGDIVFVFDATGGVIDAFLAAPVHVSLRGPSFISTKSVSVSTGSDTFADIATFSVSPYKVSFFQLSWSGSLIFQFSSDISGSSDLLNAELDFNRSGQNVDLILYNKGGSRFEENQIVMWSASVTSGSNFVESLIVSESYDQIGSARLNFMSSPFAFGTAVVQVSMYDKVYNHENGSNVDTRQGSVSFTQNITFQFGIAPPVRVLLPDVIVGVSGSRLVRVANVLLFESSIFASRVTVTDVSNPSMFSSPPVVDMQGNLSFGTKYTDSSSNVSLLVRWLDSSYESHSTSLRTRVRFVTINRPPVPITIRNITIGDQDRYDPTMTSFDDVVNCSMSYDGKDVNQTLNPLNPYQYHYVTVNGVLNPSSVVFHISPLLHKNGTLVFALIPQVYGLITMYFTAQDTGGVELGGSDTSDVFPIHVRRFPAVDPPLLFLPSFILRMDGSSLCSSTTCLQLQQPTRPPRYGLRILQDSGVNSIQCALRPGYSRPLASISGAMARSNDVKNLNVSISLNGMLTLQAANGFFGSSVIDIFIMDSENSSSSFSVPVVVINVNSAPSIEVKSSIQLPLVSSGPPILAANYSDIKWLRYTVSPGPTTVGNWYPSSMLFGSFLQNVVVEGGGCFEVWSNGSIYMEQGNLLPNNQISTSCPSCSNNHANIGACSVDGSLTCSESRASNYRCVLHSSSSSPSASIIGTWSGYCEQLSGLVNGVLQCSAGPCRHSYTVVYNGTHLQRTRGELPSSSSCSDSRPVYYVPNFVVSSSVGNNPLESLTQSIVSISVTLQSSSGVVLVSNPSVDMRTGALAFQTAPGAVGDFRIKVVAFDSSDFCCSNNFSSEVFSDVEIQAPPSLDAIVPDIISPSGGVVLSVIGRYFSSSVSQSVSVFVGSLECVGAVILSDGVITCTSPAGLGLQSVTVIVSGSIVRSATLRNAVAFATFVAVGSIEDTSLGQGFWGFAPAVIGVPIQGGGNTSTPPTSNGIGGLPSRRLLQTDGTQAGSLYTRVSSASFFISDFDRVEGIAGVSATFSFVPSTSLRPGGSITIQFPVSFFNTSLSASATELGSSSNVPFLSTAVSFEKNRNLVLTTSSTVAGGATLVAGKIFTITVTGLRMGRVRSGGDALEEVLISTSADIMWSNPVVCGPVFHSLRDSIIAIETAFTLAESNLTISFSPTRVSEFKSVVVTLTGFTSLSTAPSVTDLLGFAPGTSATSSLVGGVLSVVFSSTPVLSRSPVSFRVLGLRNSAVPQSSAQYVSTATLNSAGSILDYTPETRLPALESSLRSVFVDVNSTIAGALSSVTLNFIPFSVVSLSGGRLTITLTGFSSIIQPSARTFLGFFDSPSATSTLSDGVLTVEFSSGRLQPGRTASFVVENVVNPLTPQNSLNVISAVLSGFATSGAIASDNTNSGFLSRITPSLLDLRVKLSSSVAGAFVTATISFKPTSVQAPSSFSITLSGFSAALGQNLTVAFIPVDGMGIRKGEGFVGFNESAAAPAANATFSSGVLTVAFVSGAFLANTRAALAISGLVSPVVPQPALISLRASTFSMAMKILDATDEGTLSPLYGPLPFLAPPDPVDASFWLSLNGYWTGTCSSFAGVSSSRPDLGTVCSPVPLSVTYSVRYSSASYAYSNSMGRGASGLPSYPNIDKTLNTYFSESFSSTIQISSARDGNLKGVISGNPNNSTCVSVSLSGADSLVEWGWASLGGGAPSLQKCGSPLPLPRSMCSSGTGLYSYVCTLSRSPTVADAPSPTPVVRSLNSSNVSVVPEVSLIESPTKLHVKQGGLLSAAALSAAWGGAGRGVYIGGNFMRAGDSSFTQHIAQWYGGRYIPLAYGLDGPVNTLAIDAQFLYIGGSFSRAFQSSTSVFRSGPILKWDTSQSLYLPLFSCGESSTRDGPPLIGTGVVSSISLHDGGVAFAGRFSSICSKPAGSMAFVSKSGDLALFKGGVSGGHVASLASLGTDLYVGGSFTHVGAVSAPGIARWDGSSWNALGGGVARGAVQAIAVTGSTVFIAGNFDSVDGGRLRASGVAAWVDFRWKTLSAGIVGTVHSLSVVAPCLVVGGSFRVTGSSSTLGLARLCGGTDGYWEAMSHMPGVSSKIYAFVLFRVKD